MIRRRGRIITGSLIRKLCSIHKKNRILGDKDSESEDGNTQVQIKSTPMFYEAYKICLFLKKSLNK